MCISHMLVKCSYNKYQFDYETGRWAHINVKLVHLGHACLWFVFIPPTLLWLYQDKLLRNYCHSKNCSSLTLESSCGCILTNAITCPVLVVLTVTWCQYPLVFSRLKLGREEAWRHFWNSCVKKGAKRVNTRACSTCILHFKGGLFRGGIGG